MPKSTFYNIKEEKRKKILDVAVREFSNNTYDEVSIRHIVKEADISTGSFYRYFETKDELYIFLVDYIFDEYTEKHIKLEKEYGRKISMEEMYEILPEQKKFWDKFNESSLDIRKKYYFRTKGNLLFHTFYDYINKLDTNRDYSETEKKMMAFIINVLQYVVVEYKNLEGYDYDDETAFQIFKKILLKGYTTDI